MNSINWPALSVWVFVGQLVEHCRASAEVTGSNPVEAPKKPFFGLLRGCFNCDSTAMVTYSFIFPVKVQACLADMCGKRTRTL